MKCSKCGSFLYITQPDEELLSADDGFNKTIAMINSRDCINLDCEDGDCIPFVAKSFVEYLKVGDDPYKEVEK